MPTRARPRTRTATASKRARQLLGRWSPPRRIDLTTVRAVLVPATMTLLGEWNWRGWLPRRAREPEAGRPIAGRGSLRL